MRIVRRSKRRVYSSLVLQLLVQLLVVLQQQLVTSSTLTAAFTTSVRFSSPPLLLGCRPRVPPFHAAFTTANPTTTTRSFTRSTTTAASSSSSSSHYNHNLTHRRSVAAAAALASPCSNRSSGSGRKRLLLHCTTTTTSSDNGSPPPSSRSDRGDEPSTATTAPTSDIPGKHKWLGGAVDPTDGSIYGIPSDANDVICLYDPATAATDDGTSDGGEDGDDGGGGSTARPRSYGIQRVALPSHLAVGKFKWLRGIVCDGYLYGIPAWSGDGVLKVDLAKLKEARRRPGGGNTGGDGDHGIVSVLPLPPVPPTGPDPRSRTAGTPAPPPPSRWLWHGASLNQNRTAIYCIPSNSHDVLKIDLAASETSLLRVPESGTPPGQTNKWYGGILGRDNSVYGIPYAASGVLKINADTDTVTILGDYGVQKYNWHGGVLSPSTGAIYAFPSHHPRVMKVDTNPAARPGDDSGDSGDEGRISLLEIHRPSYDTDGVTRYKWLGGSLGVDGNVYGMPSDASSILRIDTETDHVTTFGVLSGEKNKWQGGVLAPDGRIYAVPSNARNVLCLDTTAATTGGGGAGDGSRAIELLGDLPPSKDKWQGGFVGNDGAIYCIPENFNRIMKVTPKGRESTIEFL